MSKNNLVRILVVTCLVVTLLFAFGGTSAQTSSAAEKFTIAALAGPGGTISPSGLFTVNSGSSKNFSIKPTKGFHTVDIQVDGTSVGPVSKYQFSKITSSHRIVAFFASGRVINAGASEGGSIEPSGLVKVGDGGNRAFSITPNAGYYIADVIVDGKPVGHVNQYLFKKVNEPHSIIAVFNKVFPILASASPGGSISPPGVTMVDLGDNQTYTVSPDAGYHVVDVRVDTTWIGARGLDNGTYTFTNVKAPHDIMVVFDNKYHIISRAGKGGTITPLGSTEVNSGEDLTYTINPNSGYYIFDVRVDGVSQGGVSSYALENIQSHHLIVATFAKGVAPSQTE